MLPGTLSQQFIAALDAQRDRVYGMAVGAAGGEQGSPTTAPASGKIETLLHAAVREAFAAIEKEPTADPWIAVEAALTTRGATTAGSAGLSMPADLWARLVATVQVEAARSAHTRAINPDSVLLSPDPLLAPRKSAFADDADGFDLSPSSRFLLAAAIAILVGIILTIYLITRGGSAGPAPLPGHEVVPPAATATTPATRAVESPNR